MAPESDAQRMIIEDANGEDLQLLDGRAKHNNGWFVVRSLVPKGASVNAIEWIISPHAIPDFKSEPVIQVSQVGYHPKQQKVAMIELDARDEKRFPVSLIKLSDKENHTTVLKNSGKEWGKFLRYNYLQFDFSSIEESGMYIIQYGDHHSMPFQIDADVFKRNVWQPTLEYFLPVQMCHMRINDRYKVWHGLCHIDDARMAPLDSNHFDGYLQGPSTLTKYKSGETVPNLNQGAWHDAGDFDLRVESQADEIYILSLAREAFNIDYDNTTIDQQTRIVEILQPDNKPDILQQIEHGALSIVSGYKSLGRLYRGIICPTLRQYVLLGDAADMTDNKFFDGSKLSGKVPVIGLPGSPDDRWVFTEDNPAREIEVAAGLAAAARALKGYNNALSGDCLRTAQELWDRTKENDKLKRVNAAVELLLATHDQKYAGFLVSMKDPIAQNIEKTGWVIGRALPIINDKEYTARITNAIRAYRKQIDDQEKKTPYGVPYKPNIWGAGWGIQSFGVEQYFLHTAFPDIFSATYMMQAMNFILGVHPGPNTSSFASGVGAQSLTVAYGFNRDDWSYIPGGVGSGTALIRPDFPELLEWPYLWQQTEYVMGGGASNFMFLVLATDHLLSK